MSTEAIRKVRSVRKVGSASEGGYSGIGIALSLLVVAILTVISLKATFGSNGSGSGTPNIDGTGQSAAQIAGSAEDTVALSNLESKFSSMQDQAVANGGFGGVDLAGTMGTNTVSSAGSSASSPGPVVGAVSPGDPVTGSPPSITLAIASASGNCYLIWSSGQGHTLFGRSSGGICQATSIADAPQPATTDSNGVSWQAQEFQPGGLSAPGIP